MKFAIKIGGRCGCKICVVWLERWEFREVEVVECEEFGFVGR